MKEIENNPRVHLHDLVYSLTAKVNTKYEREILDGTYSQRALYRAVFDTLKENLLLLQVNNEVDFNVPEKYLKDSSYSLHMKEVTFRKYVEELYKNEDWFTHTEVPTPFGKVHQYGLVLLKP